MDELIRPSVDSRALTEKKFAPVVVAAAAVRQVGYTLLSLNAAKDFSPFSKFLLTAMTEVIT